MSVENTKPMLIRRSKLKSSIESYKRETGRRWNEVYDDLNLTPEQGKSIRGIGGRPEPNEHVLKTAYDALVNLGHWSDSDGDGQRLAGFEIVRRHRVIDYLQEKYVGWYKGYSCSSLRPGYFAITYMNFFQNEEDFKVVRYRGGIDRENTKISHGVTYFINEEIYIFSEETDRPQEIVSIILRQNTHPPGQHIFGVLVSLGMISGASPHPAAAKIIYEYLGPTKPQMEPEIADRWWVNHNECEDRVVHRYLTEYDNFEAGDYILRGRRTF